MYLLLFRCPGGGIGRRSRLKICFLREYGFDPRPGYHLFISASPLQKASNCLKNFIFPQLLFLFALPFLHSKKMAMLTLLRVAVAMLRLIVGLRPPRRSPSRIPSFFLLRLGRDREGGGRSRALTSSAAGLVNGSSRRLPLPCYHPTIIPPGGSDDFGCGGNWWCGAKRTHSSASQRAGAMQGTQRQQRCFFSKALCFIVGKGIYCIPDNSKIVFLKFPVFPDLLSPVSN